MPHFFPFLATRLLSVRETASRYERNGFSLIEGKFWGFSLTRKKGRKDFGLSDFLLF